MNTLNIQAVLDLYAQKKEIEVSLQNKEVTVKVHEALKLEFLDVCQDIEHLVVEHFNAFKNFVNKNRELFKTFYVMHGNSYKIVDYRLKPNKEAILVVLEYYNDPHNRQVVLIPYLFINQPKLYLAARRQYVKNWYHNKLQQEIETKKNELAKMEDDILELVHKLDNFDIHYNSYMAELTKDERVVF